MTSQKGKAAIYADTQNFGKDLSQKISVIESAIDNWPDDLPDINLISVYLDAVHRDYGESRIREVVEGKIKKIPFAVVSPPEILANPVQEYAGSRKNAADIALVLDALDDLHTNRTDFVAVISNDSDFVALYYKLRKMQERDSSRFVHNRGEAPFLLITHSNSGRSDHLDNLPQQNVLQLPSGKSNIDPTVSTDASIRDAKLVGQQRAVDQSNHQQLAGAIASGLGTRHLEEGNQTAYVFTYTDAYNVMKNRYPETLEVKLSHLDFSTWFHTNIWPEMKALGGTVDTSGDHPQEYKYSLSPESRKKVLDLQATKDPKNNSTPSTPTYRD